jgi:uncharacterized membrane protein YdbT with pleckstrin-like domain
VPLAIALYGAYKQFMLRRESLSVEAGSLRYAAGLLSRSTRTMELRKVQDVRVDQTFGQRLIGTGDLSIETAGESSRLTMRSVDHPQSVAEAILQAAQGDARAAISK